MKRLTAIILAVILVLSFAACKKSTASDKKGSSSAASQKSSSGKAAVTEKDIKELDDAIKKLESMIPEGWEKYGNYGSAIYNKWDDKFLPDACFPAPIEGVKTDQTAFKDYGDDNISARYSVGPICYESKNDFREYSLQFYATEAQLEKFIKGVEAKGLVGGLDDDGSWKVYYYGGNGWFMEILFNTNVNEDGFDGMVTVSATDDLYKLPSSISGIPLPQCGIIESDYINDYTLMYFDGSVSEKNFNLAKDSLPKENYTAWFDYYTATMQDAKDYAKQLESVGWELKYESEDDGSYYSNLYKNGVYAVSNYYKYDVKMQIGFSDVVENLSY